MTLLEMFAEESARIDPRARELLRGLIGDPNCVAECLGDDVIQGAAIVAMSDWALLAVQRGLESSELRSALGDMLGIIGRTAGFMTPEDQKLLRNADRVHGGG